MLLCVNTGIAHDFLFCLFREDFCSLFPCEISLLHFCFLFQIHPHTPHPTHTHIYVCIYIYIYIYIYICITYFNLVTAQCQFVYRIFRKVFFTTNYISFSSLKLAFVILFISFLKKLLTCSC